MFFRRKRGRQRKYSFWPQWLRPRFSIHEDARQGIWILLLLMAAAAITLSILSLAGEFGLAFDRGLVILFGRGKWVLPLALIAAAWRLAKDDESDFDSANLFGLFLFVICLPSLLYFFGLRAGGGRIGQAAAEWLMPYTGPGMAAALFSTGIIVALLLLLEISLSELTGKDSLVYKIAKVIFGLAAIPFIKKVVAEEEDENDENVENTPLNPLSRGDLKEAVVKEYSAYAEASEDREADEGERENDNGGGVDLASVLTSLQGSGKAVVWPRSGIEMNYPLSLLKSKPQRPQSGNIKRNQGVIRRTLDNFGVPVAMGEVWSARP